MIYNKLKNIQKTKNTEKNTRRSLCKVVTGIIFR